MGSTAWDEDANCVRCDCSRPARSGRRRLACLPAARELVTVGAHHIGNALGAKAMVGPHRSRTSAPITGEDATGRIYAYFICIGRQQKRTSCTQKAIGIDFTEYWIEQWDQAFKLPKEILDLLRAYITDELDAVKTEATQQHAGQSKRRDRISKQQEKLLQAHYNDEIPLHLMKSEQKRITTELESIERQLASATTDHELVVTNLEAALTFTDKVGNAFQ